MITDAAIVSNIEQVSKPEELSEIEERYNFEESFKKYLGSISEEQIRNQVQQILNYSDNITGEGEYELASLVSNLCIILSEYTDSNDFKESLNRSLECLVDFDILGRLDELEAGNENSFLQVPVYAQGHLFGCVIYRMDENNFEFVLVNKGYRSKLDGDGYHDTCEAYMIPRSNLRYIVDNCLTNNDFERTLGTEEIYDAFEKKGVRIVDYGFDQDMKYIFFSDIELMNQKKGNCFYKNEEAALLFAWNNAMEEGRFNKEARPISTAELHVRYVDNIRKVVNETWYNYTRRAELLNFLDDIKDVYLKNKKFRDYCEDNPFASADEKRLEIIHIFLGDDYENLKNLSANLLDKKLDESLGMMDLQTLSKHMDVIELSKNKDVFRDVIFFSYGWYMIESIEDIGAMSRMYIEFRNEHYDIAKNLFRQMDLQYADALESLIFFWASEDEVERILELNPNSIVGNIYAGIVTDDVKYLDKVLELSPNSSSALGVRVFFADVEGDDIYKYMRIADRGIERNGANINLKYDMIDIKRFLLSKMERTEIEELYFEEVNKDDKDTLTYFNIGMYSWYLDRFEEARENFVKAANIENKYKSMYAVFLGLEGKNEEAIVQLREILDEDQDNIEALMMKIKLVRSMILKSYMIDYEDYMNEDTEKKVDKEWLVEAIADSTRIIDLNYKEQEGYYARAFFNMYAYNNKIDVPNARENALKDSRELYKFEEYVGTAVNNIFRLGEVEEALEKCLEEGSYMGMYYMEDLLTDLAYDIDTDEVLAGKVEDILKKYITVDNVRYYKNIREDMVIFAEYEKEYEKMVDILDNVLEDFLNR